MKTLNNLFKNSCLLGHCEHNHVSSDIILIDDFFKNFVEAKKFFLSREKWKCLQYYQGDARVGYESLFPSWMGKYLMKNYVKKNKVSDDAGSYSVICNYSYNDNFLTSLSNDFPHVDAMYDENVINYVCLVNLNEVSVSTKFYTYKNQRHCTYEVEPDWSLYSEGIRNNLINLYGEDNIPKNVLDKLLEEEKKYLDLNLVKIVNYNPNQAILFPMSVYHAPNLTEEFSEKSPRVLLRITFYKNFAQ